MAKPASAKEEKTTKPGTAVATAKSTAVANAMPAHLADVMGDHAGKGVSTSSQDVGIPFLYILQDLSPQAKKRDPKYVDGAEVGMIFNNQSKEIYDGDDGILFVPCFFKSALVEWIPRDDGGGWVAEYPINDPILRQAVKTDRKKPPRLPNGHDLVETKYYFGFHCKPDGTYEPAVIGFASSGLKVSREWVRQLKLVKGPNGAVAASFSKAYRLKSVLAKNGAGQEYFTFSVESERWVDSEEFAMGVTLEGECARGNVQAQRPEDDAVGARDDAEEVL